MNDGIYTRSADNCELKSKEKHHTYDTLRKFINNNFCSCDTQIVLYGPHTHRARAMSPQSIAITISKSCETKSHYIRSDLECFITFIAVTLIEIM